VDSGQAGNQDEEGGTAAGGGVKAEIRVNSILNIVACRPMTAT